jgi:hypothetical protein
MINVMINNNADMTGNGAHIYYNGYFLDYTL